MSVRDDVKAAVWPLLDGFSAAEAEAVVEAAVNAGAGSSEVRAVLEAAGEWYDASNLEKATRLLGPLAEAVRAWRAVGVLSQPQPAPTGADLIAAERQRQVDVEGWTPEHDADHDGFELSAAARAYTVAAEATTFGVNCVTFNRYRPGEQAPSGWPWEPEYWKPSDDAFRNLVKAGALIAAEIDRLLRSGVGS